MQSINQSQFRESNPLVDLLVCFVTFLLTLLCFGKERLPIEPKKIRKKMVTCAVTTCKNTSGKISKNKDGITFHRFPREKRRRKCWEVAVNRELGWASTLSSTVCSQHFEANDFYLTESGLRRLSINAIPSINISAVEDPDLTTLVNAQRHYVDIKPKDTQEVIDLKYKIRKLEVISENRKREMDLMRQSKYQLKKKLEVLNRMIKHLVQSKKCGSRLR